MGRKSIQALLFIVLPLAVAILFIYLPNSSRPNSISYNEYPVIACDAFLPSSDVFVTQQKGIPVANNITTKENFCGEESKTTFKLSAAAIDAAAGIVLGVAIFGLIYQILFNRKRAKV